MGVIDAYNFKTLFVYYVKIFSVEEYFSEINFKKKLILAVRDLAHMKN